MEKGNIRSALIKNKPCDHQAGMLNTGFFITKQLPGNQHTWIYKSPVNPKELTGLSNFSEGLTFLYSHFKEGSVNKIQGNDNEA